MAITPRSRYVAGMDNPDRLEALLTEIRDLVREQTEMGRRAVEQQERATRALAAAHRYRNVVTVAAILVLLLAAAMLVFS